MSEIWHNKINEFVAAILHGDEAHRAWLMDAARAFIAGEKVPQQKATPPAGQSDAMPSKQRGE